MSDCEPEVCVCICTYNRADLLRSCLESLAQQEGELPTWELLVVDNNSGDHTRSVVESFGERLPIRYLFEPQQGLSRARNRALSAYRGELLLFTDDDVNLAPDWLKAVVRGREEFPDAAYFGGRVLPLWEMGRPAWLHDDKLALLTGVMVHYDLGAGAAMYNDSDPLPFGASFAITRAVVERLEPFRVDLGVSGSVPGRGEEVEYIGRARRLGFAGAYLGTAVCFHRQDLERFRLPSLYRHGVQQGLAHARMDYPTEGGRLRTWLLEVSYAVRGAGQVLKGRGDRLRQCVINMGIQAGLRTGMRERRRFRDRPESNGAA